MRIYRFSKTTKEYIDSENARVNTLKSMAEHKTVYVIPRDCTTVEPVFQEGYTPVWNGEVWNLIEDHRGEQYWLDTDEYGTEPHIMEVLGAFPENAVFEPPAKTLGMLKIDKLEEIRQWTEEHITGGFVSDNVTYDSDIDTQITMQGIALNVNTEEFIEKYPDGCPVRGYDEGSDIKTIHWLNAEGVLRFCADLSKHIGACKQIGWQLQGMVDNAETKDDLDKIKWIEFG